MQCERFLTVGAPAVDSSSALPATISVCFGCGGNAEDSIEHYCRCPAVLNVLRTQLRIIVTPQRAITFWTMAFNHSDDVIKCSALSSYAAYKVFNIYRTRGCIKSTATAIDAMKESIIQVAGSNAELGRFLDERWKSQVIAF